MRILILDDEETRHRYYSVSYKGHDITHVYAYGDFYSKIIQGSPWDLIHLDHDLNDVQISEDGSVQEFTGRHASLRICELEDGQLPKRVIIHSFNSAGAQVMLSNLTARGDEAVWQPFGVSSTRSL